MALHGAVLSQDKIVAEVANGRRKVTDPALCPLYLLKYDDVEGWLRRRAIDVHRTNSRLLRKALRLAPNDDLEAVLRVHGATITDCYWFRAEGEDLTYDQVRFRENQFSELALFGSPDSFQRGAATAVTPELTNTGSFEKCWKLLDGGWWMYKAGSELEQFSELFIYHLGRLMGLPMAHYERDGKYIRSRDFTGEKMNFEPMYSVLLDEEDYSLNYKMIRELCPQAAAEYVGMVYLDALIMNMDRHTHNYGFLRDRETGELRSLAPLFDHNIALVARGYPLHSQRGGDLLQQLFVDFLQEVPQATEELLRLGICSPTAEMVGVAIQASDLQSFSQGTIQPDFLAEFILSAQEWIQRKVPEIFQGACHEKPWMELER